MKALGLGGLQVPYPIGFEPDDCDHPEGYRDEEVIKVYGIDNKSSLRIYEVCIICHRIINDGQPYEDI